MVWLLPRCRTEELAALGLKASASGENDLVSRRLFHATSAGAFDPRHDGVEAGRV